MKASLRARRLGVDGPALAVHDVAVEGVLDVRLSARDLRPPYARVVRLVGGEERDAARVRVEVARAEFVLVRQTLKRAARLVARNEAHEVRARRAERYLGLGPVFCGPPRPGVSEPEVREYVERRVFGAAVEGFDADDYVLAA